MLNVKNVWNLLSKCSASLSLHIFYSSSATDEIFFSSFAQNLNVYTFFTFFTFFALIKEEDLNLEDKKKIVKIDVKSRRISEIFILFVVYKSSIIESTTGFVHLKNVPHSMSLIRSITSSGLLNQSQHKHRDNGMCVMSCDPRKVWYISDIIMNHPSSCHCHH